MEVLLLRSIISFVWAHIHDECSQNVNSAFTDRTNVEYQQAIHSVSSSARKLILSQTVLCLTSRKREKCFEHGQNCSEVENEHGPKMKWCTVSSVTLCKIQPHHSVFICLTYKVWQLTVKRDKSWLQFFSAGSPLCFFFGRLQRQREKDGRMERNHTTLTHLRHWWKPAGCLETGARTAWGCHGNRGTWRVERTQTSLPLLRFERSRIDMSARPKGKAEREETFPACILQHLCEAKCATSSSTEPVPTRERNNGRNNKKPKTWIC